METERRELETYLTSLNASAAPAIMEGLELFFQTIESGKMPIGSRADLIKDEIRRQFMSATALEVGNTVEMDLGGLAHKTKWDEENFWRTMVTCMLAHGGTGQLHETLKRKYGGVVADALNGNERGLRSALSACLFGRLETVIRGIFPTNAPPLVVDALVENAKEAAVVYVALALRKPSAAEAFKPLMELCLRYPLVCLYGNEEVCYSRVTRRLTLGIFHD